MNTSEKDQAIKIAQEIAKYAFMLAFYISYDRAQAEKHHCLENLKLALKELERITNEKL